MGSSCRVLDYKERRREAGMESLVVQPKSRQKVIIGAKAVVRKLSQSLMNT